jgi:hypothetical protein
MKKISISIVAASLFVMMAFGVSFAAPGGMPAAHGVDGATFGTVVSGVAQTAPSALANHVSGGRVQ